MDPRGRGGQIPEGTWRRAACTSVGKEPTEPLGGRIVEAPEDDYQANTVRNPRSGWVAYVPVGSLEKGKQLVDGAGKTTPCGMCHGTDLRASPTSGHRRPVAELHDAPDVGHEARHAQGPAQLMKPVVANLTEDDMLDIVAYLASINPPVRRPARDS